jgi:hypothetical protein
VPLDRLVQSSVFYDHVNASLTVQLRLFGAHPDQRAISGMQVRILSAQPHSWPEQPGQSPRRELGYRSAIRARGFSGQLFGVSSPARQR